MDKIIGQCSFKSPGVNCFSALLCNLFERNKISFGYDSRFFFSFFCFFEGLLLAMRYLGIRALHRLLKQLLGIVISLRTVLNLFACRLYSQPAGNLARIVSTGVSGLSPEIMGLGPVEATRRALAHAGMSIGDIDLVEINEAFAAQVLADGRELGFDWAKVNVNGGAIALGHPIGASGARILTTLLHALKDLSKKRGLASICIGGGGALARRPAPTAAGT